ncbi:MAG: beta-lactamase family protein [Crocinitomicaceae bacterium]|nr:beta-lactamase family protein [Crocinitomicaceae bacterium]
MKTLITLLKKSLRFFVLLLLALLIVANAFILLSGRTYLYKGIYLTYLSGKTGPSIYDLDNFPKRMVAKGETSTPWNKSKKYTQTTAVQNFEEYNNTLETKAFLLFKNDSLIFEKYWDKHTENTLSNSFSAAKTVVALLIGIAVEEGKIKNLDEPVGNYIPEFNREDLSIVTIRDLLLMASGLDWSESGKNPLSNNAESYYGDDLYGLVTRQKRIGVPGRTFIYQSGNSQLLGFIIKKATGMSVAEYCSDKLWSKMGMDANAYWSLDKENGDEKAFCCLYATARDFGKLGQLIANRGKWGSQQLIPTWYFEEMVSPPDDMTTVDAIKNYQYGLHIWTYQGYTSPVYYCRGILGQYMIAIPDENMVIVRLGEKRAERIETTNSSVSKRDIKRIGHTKDFIQYINFAEQIRKEIGE